MNKFLIPKDGGFLKHIMLGLYKCQLSVTIKNSIKSQSGEFIDLFTLSDYGLLVRQNKTRTRNIILTTSSVENILDDLSSFFATPAMSLPSSIQIIDISWIKECVKHKRLVDDGMHKYTYRLKR